MMKLMLNYEDIKQNETINTYIKKADESLSVLGFIEHSFPHVCRKAAETLGLQFKLIVNEQELI